MLLTIPYPAIDPAALRLGPLVIRWYALAYIAGLLLGWRYCMYLARRPPYLVSPQAIDDFLVWATFGVVLGGRTGYVLFYRPGYYIEHPLDIPALWHGGMSFHGGALGVTLALALFTRRRSIPLLAMADIVTCAVPIGLFFGRIANFINGELWGRPTDVPWAMIFPNDPDRLPRHPSQLYQAGLEGIVLFAVLAACERAGARTKPGLISGIFLIGYAAARMTGELFRQPDQQLGFLFAGITMGQLLSLPMVGFGAWLVARALGRASIRVKAAASGALLPKAEG